MKDKHRGEEIKDDAVRRNHERGVFINSLLLQQEALKNIWDSEEEDVYELGSLGCRYRPISICDLRRCNAEGTTRLDYIMTMPRRLVARRLGHLHDETMKEIAKRLMLSLGIE